MSDSKKYYYLKLKEDFFEKPDMKILEALPNGYIYSNILLKLYLKSLRDDGRLMYKGNIPYDVPMISAITGHCQDTVKGALQTLNDMQLIDVLDNGAIFMLEIQNFIGQSSTEGDRKRDFRRRIDSERQLITGTVEGEGAPEKMEPEEICIVEDGQTADKCPTNVHQSIEIRDKRLDIKKYMAECSAKLWDLYPRKEGKAQTLKRLPALIKQHGYEQLERCVERYVQKLQAENTPAKFIKQGSTFFGNGYVDYLDENYHGPSVPERPKAQKTAAAQRFDRFEGRLSSMNEQELDALIRKKWDRDGPEG